MIPVRGYRYRVNSHRGIILLLTLWMSIVLSIIAYSLTYQVRMEMKLSKNFRQNTQARALAIAGISKAVGDLKNDLIIDTSEGGIRLDAEGDIWSFPDDKTDIELGPGIYSASVIDENSKININSANLEVLKELLKVLDVEEDEVDEIANAIIDWRDLDDKPLSGKGEKENTYYSSLIQDVDEDEFLDDESQILYRCKNDYYTTVEELLDVYGITPELFYGYDPEEKLEHYLSGKKEDEDEVYIGLRDLVTVNGDGQLNVNTASFEVLTAVIAAAQVGGTDPEGLAEEIIDHRRGNRESDFDNDDAFHNWHQLSEVDGLNPGGARRMYTVQRLSTTSDCFQIISTGTVQDISKTIIVTVDRRFENYRVSGDDDDERFEGPMYRRRDSRVEDEGSFIREPTVRALHWLEL